MLNCNFTFGGVNSTAVGIKMQDYPVLSDAVPELVNTKVPGRNGDLTEWDGSFKNRTYTAKCYVLAKDAASALAAINKMAFGKMGYQKLVDSQDPEHYLLAQVKQGAERDIRAGILAPFTLQFDCKPQRFRTSGNITVSIEGQVFVFPEQDLYPGINVVPFCFAAKIENPAFDSVPMFTIYGKNLPGQLVVNDCVIDISNIPDTGIVIDCDIQDCYSPGGNENLNHLVTFSTGEFPTFPGGTNNVSWSGETMSAITIQPRWWDL